MTKSEKINCRVTTSESQKCSSKGQLSKFDEHEKSISNVIPTPINSSAILETSIQPWAFNLECGCWDDWYGLFESNAILYKNPNGGDK